MKKQSKINLHNLSQSEVASRELSLLKGGVVCLAICGDQICKCDEGPGAPESANLYCDLPEETPISRGAVNASYSGNNPN